MQFFGAPDGTVRLHHPALYGWVVETGAQRPCDSPVAHRTARRRKRAVPEGFRRTYEIEAEGEAEAGCEVMLRRVCWRTLSESTASGEGAHSFADGGGRFPARRVPHPRQDHVGMDGGDSGAQPRSADDGREDGVVLA
eukprot:scaffold25494_cov146-Isochrysis_galbana.AAC.3